MQYYKENLCNNARESFLAWNSIACVFLLEKTDEIITVFSSFFFKILYLERDFFHKEKY